MIMKRNRIVEIIAFCGAISMISPIQVLASQEIKNNSGPGLAAGGYIVTVDAESVNINTEQNGTEVLAKAVQGTSYPVLEDMGDGWIKVKVGDSQGYLPLEGNASISEEQEALQAEEAADGAGNTAVTTKDASSERRDALVQYGLQFVGGRYRAGGSDPHTGADCSGFTSYVLRNGAGVNVNRSSSGQATQGVTVSADQMRPGDLIFYGNGRRVNHVAMYIGNGQVVHASTYATGIKISNWNYRAPVRIANVLGD